MLSIQTTNSTVEYHIQKASVSIEAPKSQMSMETSKAQMSVDNQPPQMQIDSTEMWASLGLYGPIRATMMHAQQGKDIAFQSVGETGDKWRAMMQPGASNAQMVQMARQNMREGMAEMELTFTPEPPEISWTPPQFNISWTPHQLNISWQTNTMADIQYHPYSVGYSVTPYDVSVQYLGEPKTGGDVLRVLRQYA